MVELQKRKIQWAISLFLVMLYFSGLPAQAQYGGGSGEPNDPYLIYTAEQMNEIGAEPNDWDKHFKVMADIDLSGYSYDTALIAPDTNNATGRFDGTSFTGTFDGNCYIVSHLMIDGESYLGLFGRLDFGAEIKDLGVLDFKMTGSDAGGLVCYNGGRITNCHSTGHVVSTGACGGLVGYNDEGGTITGCYSSSRITGTSIHFSSNSVGGLVGKNSGTITGCYSTGEAQGTWGVGSLVGDNSGTIINCYSTGHVSPGNYWPYCCGGLVGRHYDRRFCVFHRALAG